MRRFAASAYPSVSSWRRQQPVWAQRCSARRLKSYDDAVDLRTPPLVSGTGLRRGGAPAGAASASAWGSAQCRRAGTSGVSAGRRSPGAGRGEHCRRAVSPALPGLAGTTPRPGGVTSRRSTTVCRRGRPCRHFLALRVRYRGRRCDVSPAGNCVPVRAVLPALPGRAGTIPRQEVRRLAGRQLCAGAGGLAGTSWSGWSGTAAGRCVVSPAGHCVPVRAVLPAFPGRAGLGPRPGGASVVRSATGHFIPCRPRPWAGRGSAGQVVGAGGSRLTAGPGGTDLALDPASLEQVQPNLAAAGPGLGTGAIGLGAPPKGRGNRADGKVTRRVFNVRFPCNPHPAKSCCGTPCSSNFSRIPRVSIRYSRIFLDHGALFTAPPVRDPGLRCSAEIPNPLASSLAAACAGTFVVCGPQIVAWTASDCSSSCC